MTRSLDHKDLKLLALLRNNARASIKELAAGVELSRTALIERIRRLEEDGVIEGYTLKKAQREAPLTFFLLIKTHQPSCELIAPRLTEIHEITACHSLGGDIDIIIELSTNTPQRANEIREEISGYPEVAHIATSTLLKTHFEK
ncbi:Lrp/AsnC family transcriptional regulator [Kiloniella sp. EL199]|uniref:Lrp/AsnC family transcriptional regulator n=1 Tax=Kiloniella sp. EL199 TaxID=2107581 RepID=UPI000EA37F07|nr:Lrp/AsnC family transcriptional regulator [Kiloniella sp. EL199]